MSKMTLEEARRFLAETKAAEASPAPVLAELDSMPSMFDFLQWSDRFDPAKEYASDATVYTPAGPVGPQTKEYTEEELRAYWMRDARTEPSIFRPDLVKAQAYARRFHRPEDEYYKMVARTPKELWRKQCEAYVASLNTPQKALHAAKAAIKGFVHSVADVPQGIAIIAKKLDPFKEYEDKDVEDLETYKWGQWLRDSIDRTIRTDPRLSENFWLTKAASSVGSILTLLGPGLGAKALSGSPTVAAGLTGALMEGGSAFGEVRRLGGTKQQAIRAGLKQMPVGFAQVLGAPRLLFSRIATRLDTATGGELRRAAARVLQTAVAGAEREAIQEAADQLARNVNIRQELGKEARGLWDSVAESGMLGFLVGGFVGGTDAAFSQYMKSRRDARGALDTPDGAATFAARSSEQARAIVGLADAQKAGMPPRRAFQQYTGEAKTSAMYRKRAADALRNALERQASETRNVTTLPQEATPFPPVPGGPAVPGHPEGFSGLQGAQLSGGQTTSGAGLVSTAEGMPGRPNIPEPDAGSSGSGRGRVDEAVALAMQRAARSAIESGSEPEIGPRALATEKVQGPLAPGQRAAEQEQLTQVGTVSPVPQQRTFEESRALAQKWLLEDPIGHYRRLRNDARAGVMPTRADILLAQEYVKEGTKRAAETDDVNAWKAVGEISELYHDWGRAQSDAFAARSMLSPDERRRHETINSIVEPPPRFSRRLAKAKELDQRDRKRRELPETALGRKAKAARAELDRLLEEAAPIFNPTKLKATLVPFDLQMAKYAAKIAAASVKAQFYTYADAVLHIAKKRGDQFATMLDPYLSKEWIKLRLTNKQLDEPSLAADIIRNEHAGIRAEQVRQQIAEYQAAITKRLKSHGFDLNNIEDILQDEDQAAALRREASILKSSWWSKAVEHASNFAIFGTATQLINIGSNLAVGASHFSVVRLATILAAKARGAPREEGAATFGELLSMGKGALAGLMASAKMAVRAFNLEEPVFNKVLGMPDTVKLAEKNVSVGGPFKGRYGRALRAMGWRPTLFGDEFGRDWLTYIEGAALSYREGLRRGYEGQELADYVDAQIASPGPTEAWQAAYDKASKLTFTAELGKLGNLVLDLRQYAPFTKLFPFLFVKTPTNIAKSAINLTVFDAPYVLAKAARAGIKEQTWSEWDEQLAKKVLAGMVFWALLDLCDPEDPWISGSKGAKGMTYQEKQVLGMPPNSIKNPFGGPDEYISYSRFDPFATAISVTVDAIQNFWYDLESVPDVGVAMNKALDVLQDQVASKFYLRGVSDLISIFTASNKGDQLVKMVTNTSGLFVPNQFKAIRRASQEYIKERRSWGKGPAKTKMMIQRGLEIAEIPGFEAYDKITAWGRTLPKPGSPAGGPLAHKLWRSLMPSGILRANPARGDVILNAYNETVPDDEEFGYSELAPYYISPRDAAGKGRQKIYYTPQQYHDLSVYCGQTADALVRVMNLDDERPDISDAQAVLLALEDARVAAKQEFVRNLRHGTKATDPERLASHVRQAIVLRLARRVGRIARPPSLLALQTAPGNPLSALVDFLDENDEVAIETLEATELLPKFAIQEENLEK